ncbi:hypothetical protein FB567DRAFT_260630 [Paraphoma chrysanthemicola]|uniref:DUF7820 domain-containing protein n=1 Tax=Paraphoma chrysanthemicola TaxID=798071 RepID=A0A8K0QT37_9PLEO|nr:hypothetical protein FB567DRAFT_260630 [Paraphoma chrysanthemicola]
MHLPRRSLKSIQPLPSIYTAFPASSENNTSSENSGRCLIRDIEDGIQVVPFERSNTLSAPILSPDQAEKEVFIMSQRELSPSDKPLPRLPRSLWAKLSLKQRMLAILGVQLAMLLTIGLAIMAAKRRTSHSDQSATTSSTGENPSTPLEMDPLPRGPFAVPIQLPQQQNSACLARTNESVAWQCASDTAFQISILPSLGGSNVTMITLGSLPPTNGTIYHGHQAPDIQPVELRPVGDAAGVDDQSAYHFRATYNRIVLLKESDLTPAERPRPQPVMRHPTFQAGETLWRCVFNETLMDGYIFPKQNTTAITTTNTTVLAATSLPKIPHVLKLVEQRMPNGKGPYCEKMKVQDGGLVKIQGEKVMLNLAEPAAEADATANKGAARTMRFRVRQQAAEKNYCRCQWMVQ